MSEERRQEIHNILSNYGAQVHTLGVVEQVIVEVNSKNNKVRFLDVLSESPSVKESRALSQLNRKFRCRLLELRVPVGSVSCISQEEYKNVMKECKKPGIKVWKLIETPKAI